MNQENIKKRLSEVFATSTPVSFDLNDLKLIIFSDLHKGEKDKSDDFLKCKPYYHAALGYYFEAGYQLVLLGDVEDLWECRPKKVIKAYRDTFELEKRFAEKGRYWRICGNHDEIWDSTGKVNQYLKPILGPGITVDISKKLAISSEGKPLGYIFLVHGHQGSISSDMLKGPAKFVVRNLWRPIQRLTGWRTATASADYDIRSIHEIAMLEWIVEINTTKLDGKVIMVAGHTHHPVFASEAHDCYLENEIEKKRKQIQDHPTDQNLKDELYYLVSQLEFSRAKSNGKASLACGDKPWYFNSGCCSYSNGTITGIEISGGSISLVRWPDYEGKTKKVELRQFGLKDLF
jgi:UDP-2,3-diacylglucosamine pyrophosphatase LpxH